MKPCRAANRRWMNGMGVALAVWAAACARSPEFAGATQRGRQELPPPRADDAAPPRRLVKEFTAGVLGDGRTEFLFTPTSLTASWDMEVAPPTRESFRQDERPWRKSAQSQGGPGQAKSQSFPAAREDALDLVLVVDNSASMRPYQAKLARSLEPLLSHIDNADWQIAIVTTDSSCLLNGARPGTTIRKADYVADPEATRANFAATVAAIGDGGINQERGLHYAHQSLRGVCQYYYGQELPQPWRRDDAKAAVLILTDEDVCGSSPEASCDVPSDTPEGFVAAHPGVTVYGLFSERGDGCTDYDADGWVYPERYYALVDAMTKGKRGRICQDDYGATLEAISAHMGRHALTSFTLDESPDAGSIAVRVDGTPWPGAFRVEGRTVTLLEAPDATSREVTIAYGVGAAPMRDAFPLPEAADPATVRVTVNGAPVPPPSVTVENGGTLVRLAPAPPARAEIRVDYRPADAMLAKEFPLRGDAMAGTLRVTVDGAPADAWAYDPGRRVLRFAAPPADGAGIDVVYAQPGDVKTTYPVARPAGMNWIAWSLVDDADGRAIPARLGDQGLAVPPEEVWNGRRARFTAALAPDATETVVPLPAAAPGEARWTADGADPACLAAARRRGDAVVFPCPPAQVTRVTVTYPTWQGLATRFPLGEDVAGGEWRVWRDGAPFTEFRVEDGAVLIEASFLQPATRIRVEVRWDEEDGLTLIPARPPGMPDRAG